MLRRLATASFVAVLVVPNAVRADDAAPPNDEQAFVDVTVDGVDAGRRAIVVENDGDVFVRYEEASAFDLPQRAAARRSIGTRAYLSLRALAPDVRFVFDEARLRLAVDVAPRLLGTQTLSLVTASPSPGVDVSRPASAFGNYFVSDTSGFGASGFLEAGVSRANRLLYSSESFDNGAFVRGLTYYAIDDPARARRVQLGDASFAGDGLTGDASFFGVSSRRAFELDPYAYRFPSPSVGGLIATSGTAEVYVNGVVARTIPLLPGGFDLTNLPVQSGANDVTVVVRDSAGLVQTFSQSYYRPDTLLRKGLTDDSYGVGFVRAPAPSNAYGAPALFGAYRLGATNAATYGGRVEAAAHDVVGEASADLRVPLGGVHLAVATSDAARVVGFAYDAAVSLQERATSLSASVASHGAAFHDLVSQQTFLQPATAQTVVAFSQQVTHALSFVVQDSLQRFAGLPLQHVATVGLSALLGGDTTASAQLQRSRVGGAVPVTFATVSLVRALGHGRTFVASVDRGAGTSSSALQYRADPPSAETGAGYGVRYDRTPVGADGEIDVTDHAPFADLSALVQRAPGGRTTGDVAIGGGIASVAGRTMVTRPIGDAFALVDAGESGLDVSLDGRPVGRTNRSGELMVGSLSPYAENRIAVDAANLPIDREVRTGQRSVAPGYRGGTVARLAVETVRYTIGKIRIGSGEAAIVPVDGVLILTRRDGTSARSPLDDDGGYYFENLVAGTYAARVRSVAGTCAFAFVVPSSGGRIATDLGIARCIAGSAS